jgi:hypothetical protein
MIMRMTPLLFRLLLAGAKCRAGGSTEIGDPNRPSSCSKNSGERLRILPRTIRRANLVASLPTTHETHVLVGWAWNVLLFRLVVGRRYGEARQNVIAVTGVATSCDTCLDNVWSAIVGPTPKIPKQSIVGRLDPQGHLGIGPPVRATPALATRPRSSHRFG